MDVRVSKKENFYFILKVLGTIAVIVAAVRLMSSLSGALPGVGGSTVTVVITYAVCIWLFYLFQKIYLVAYMKGNGVTVSERQFPEVYQVYKDMLAELGIKKAPALFVLQQGGALNAFAVRFSGRNYVALYSDVFALIASDMDAVKFVLAHELGHVKRHHMSKRFWTFPSSVIPFLTPAYSRSCEYTCDNVGADLAKGDATRGLLLLAAGKELYGRVDVRSYIDDARVHETASVKFIGLFLSHPYIPRRLRNLNLA